MQFHDFKLKSFGLSDIGLTRLNNEDIWLALHEYGFFVLADGMGGHNAGEIAAQETVRFLTTSIEELLTSTQSKWDIFELSSLMKLFIENTNSWVNHLGNKKKEYKGMGTTLCTLLFHKNSLIHSHVGDSRIYRFRMGKFEQLTKDHSLKNELITQGVLPIKEAINFPHKNILTRAIGTHNTVEAEIHVAPVSPNDLYLMCTDGLSDYVPDKEILAILSKNHSPKSTAKTLIETAKKRGGNDNITVIVIKVEENLPRQQRHHFPRPKSP